VGWEEPDPALVVSLLTDGDWDYLLRRYEPNFVPRPLERCFEVARSRSAKSVVIETRYVDLDYRSEYSAFFSKTFAEIPDTTHRLHFFDTNLANVDLSNLSKRVRDGYLGYVVIRPSPLGRVGRTLLLPPPEIENAVQSAVVGVVNLFGQELTVCGVPFAQQDTQFGRCAHVAAWICHFTAHLRGEVSRRLMADFSIFADASVAEGRPLPSQGLTGLQLSNLMREFELPPIVYRMGAIQESGQEPHVPAHGSDDDPGTWDTRAIAVLCRFLNSGFPMLVGTHEHAFVIIGYRREKPKSDPWITFIRHDDQRGPYLLVHNILDDIDDATGDQHSPWQLLLAPVPDQLWLLPEAAERVGRMLLRRFDEVEGVGTLSDLYRQNQLAFRTVAMTSARYKRESTIRRLDSNCAKEIRFARLSRLVWVVEAIDRRARSSGRPSVLGEAVFDSTSSDNAPNVFLLRVPGALLVHQSDGTIRSPLDAPVRRTRSAAQWQP
jgi:hypothetical protein